MSAPNNDDEASSFTVCSPCGNGSNDNNNNNNNNNNDDDSATTSSSPIPSSSTNSSPGDQRPLEITTTRVDNQNNAPPIATESVEIQHQQQHIPPPPPPPPLPLTTTTNVGELVNKAKKAAASLWMILHAQNCRIHKCHHRGCAETRLLLVHVKTCPVGSSVDYHSCPTCTKGCNETRKLLAHYRKCKDIRTRLMMMGSSKGSSSQHGRRSLLQPDLYRGSSSSCLICSLVARYAKGMLDSRPSGYGGSSSGGSGSSSGISSSLVSASLLNGKFNIERRRGLSDSGIPPPPPPPPPRPTIERTPSMTLMPPPPPRFGSSCPTSTSTSTTITSTNSILRRSSFATLDDNAELIVPPDGDVGGDLDNNNKDRNRLRAGSYDERQSRRVKFAPGITMNIMLQQQQQQQQQTVDGYDDPRCIRPRSASCSNSSSSSSESSSSGSSESSCGNNNNTTNACGDGICEAIVEEEDEEGYVEQPMFSMDL